MSLHRFFRRYGSQSKPSFLMDGIRKILRENPESIRETDDGDADASSSSSASSFSSSSSSSSLPLHTAFEEIDSIDLQIVKQLVDAHPDSVRTKDADGKLPIHYACESPHCADNDIIGYLLDRYPESVGLEDAEGFTPLHHVCYQTFAFGATTERQLELIDYLLERCPEPVRFDDFLLRIVPYEKPKHAETIALQTKGVPDHLRQPHLLLHAMCHIRSAGITFLWYLQQTHKQQSLLDDNENSLFASRDQAGNTVLHTLLSAEGFTALEADTSRTFTEECDDKATMSIFKWLCKLRPELVFARNHAGDTPLHSACRSRFPVAFLEDLLMIDEDGADRRNNDGQLPIHLLVSSSSSSSDPAVHPSKRLRLEKKNSNRRDSTNDEPCYVMAAIKTLMRSSSQPLLGMADPTTGLVPFLAAAAMSSSPTAENEGEDDNGMVPVVDIVAAILREDPSPLIPVLSSKKRKR